MLSRTRLLSRLVLSLVLVGAPTILHAQFDAATVLGRVVDQSGGAVPGATVTLISKATTIRSSVVTDETGLYQFLNLRVGEYVVEASLQGFSTAVAPDVTVTVNARQRVDLTLAVGGVGEVIEVTGASRVIETDSSDHGQVVGQEQIVNLPLQAHVRREALARSQSVRRRDRRTARAEPDLLLRQL